MSRYERKQYNREYLFNLTELSDKYPLTIILNKILRDEPNFDIKGKLIVRDISGWVISNKTVKIREEYSLNGKEYVYGKVFRYKNKSWKLINETSNNDY